MLNSIVFGFQEVRFAIATAVLSGILLCCSVWAQSPQQPAIVELSGQDGAISAPNPEPIMSVHEKWKYVVKETTGPLTFGGAAFNALFSQATHTIPTYGGNGVALAKRYGASVADIATENFFGDFVTASAFHEDPRYFRLGERHRFWSRVGYAISRAVVIRKNSGGNEFNFDNFIGNAASTGLSNLYYPPRDRHVKANLAHFGIDVADYGFVNLAPEFWPDFQRKFFVWIH